MTISEPTPTANTDQAAAAQASETRPHVDAEGNYTFQAEVSRLLQLMVHSVYSEREIFLRELISNAADALDKLRYQAVTQPGLVRDDADLKITIKADKTARTLTISDNGIGMTRDELIENLGTIARSGTRAFLDRVKSEDQEKLELIGQFGVGFYSAFMVADKVDVISRQVFEDTVHLWSSDGTGKFKVSEADAEGFLNGTQITLHLNKDSDEFLEASELTRIVRTYSDHVTFPIALETEQDGETSSEQLNAASALWRKRPSEVEDQQYKEFYQHTAGMWDEPQIRIHYRAEGRQEFTVLLFVPGSQPFDLYDPNRRGRIKLYVRRVFISDDTEILPAYLRFVRGVIDSEDMPLNLSREMLQNNTTVAAIRKAVTSKVLNEIVAFAKKDTKGFDTFWENFGPVLKEGIYEDPERRDSLFDISRFHSTKTGRVPGENPNAPPTPQRGLLDYVADMKENQTEIFYLVGEKLEQLQASPFLEAFRARDVEVLLLADPVDNFWVTTALGFDGKPFKSITQGDIKLDDINLVKRKRHTKDEPDAETISGILRAVAEVLGDAVSEVRESQRLVDSPACLVAPEGGTDRALGKLLERQQSGDAAKPVLEINPNHAWMNLLMGTSRARSAGEAPSRRDFEDLAWLLFDQANILDSVVPTDPVKYTERLNRLIFSDTVKHPVEE